MIYMGHLGYEWIIIGKHILCKASNIQCPLCLQSHETTDSCLKNVFMNITPWKLLERLLEVFEKSMIFTHTCLFEPWRSENVEFSQEISGHDRGSRSLLTLQDILNWKMQVIEQCCRFGNFRENLIFAKNIKIHISVVKNSRLRQDLPISVNDRVILPFREGFIFTKLRICYMRSFAKINASWKFSNLQYSFLFILAGLKIKCIIIG